jgi:vancomycin resistance protein YoaR
MPQDTQRDGDTVRLHPDGTISRARPARPSARPSAATRPVAAEPADADRLSETQVIPPAAASDDLPSAGSAPDDTVVVDRVDGPRSSAEDAAASLTPPQDTGPDSDGPDSDGPDSDGPDTGPDSDAPAGDGPGEPPAPGAAARSWWRRRAVVVPAAAVAVLGAAYGVDLLTAGGSVPRGTVVDGVHLGGLSPAAAEQRLQQDVAPQVLADRPLTAADVQDLLHPPAAGIALDVPGTVDAVGTQPLNPWTRLTSLFSDRAAEPLLTVDQTALDAELEQVAAAVDRAPVDATIALTGTTPQLVAPVEGRSLDRSGAAAAILSALRSGSDPATPVDLPVAVTPVHVDTAEAQRVLDQTVTPALAAPITVLGTGAQHSVDVPVSAIAAALTFTPGQDGTLTVGIDPAALQTAMGADFAAFGSPAKDARFEVSGGKVTVVPSVDGQGISPADLAGQLLGVLDHPAPRSVSATLGPVPAAFTTEQAQALGIVEKVSSFTTNFAMSPSATNIRVIAQKVDGALVKPGETFSLNGFTGPRGTAQGYVPANVIEGGQLAKAVGGGISQFATTMFNAVFFAGLEDVHHKTHSFYISRYPAGREATVFDGLIDLAWKNDTDTGIYVQTQWVSGGSITVTFWGTRHYDIESVSGEKRNITAPSVQDKVDDGTCIPQSGAQGFDITVTRVFKDPASHAVLRQETFNTHYAAEAVIHCLPPAAPASGQPAPDGATPPATTGASAPATSSGRRPGRRGSEGGRTPVRRRRS